AKVLADQFIGHVRIGLVGVQKVGAVLELGSLLLNLGKLGLPLLELAMIAAPGEDPVFAGDRVTGEGADDKHRQRGHRGPADHGENSARSPHHDVMRIMSESRRQVKRMIWWTKR